MMDPLHDLYAWLQGRGLSQNTRLGYLRDLHLFARWLQAAHDRALEADRLRGPDVEEYSRHLLLERRVNARTFNRRLAALRAFVRWARERGNLDRDPLSIVSAERESRPSPRGLERREVVALERTAERAVRGARTAEEEMLAVRDRTILTLLLHTGLRVSELAEVNIQDCELRGQTGMLLIRGCGRGRARAVPLDRTALQAMLDWQEARPRGSTAALLVDRRGRRLSPRTIQARIQALARSAGVDASAQTLRNTFARGLVTAGVDLDRVAELLGHQDPQSARVYSIASRSDLQQMVEVLA